MHNNLTNHNGTSFHWHGIRQFETNWLDGVPGVTQCPSKVYANKSESRRGLLLMEDSQVIPRWWNSELCNMALLGTILTTAYSVSASGSFDGGQ